MCFVQSSKKRIPVSKISSRRKTGTLNTKKSHILKIKKPAIFYRFFLKENFLRMSESRSQVFGADTQR